MPILTPTQYEHLATKCAENRILLFGGFDLSNNITKNSKNRKWDEILHELVSMGAPIKSVKHLRDVRLLFNFHFIVE